MPTLSLDDLVLHDVNKHDIWDRRESAVANADVWKSACEEYRQSSHFQAGIPLKFHQIWIGTRQPPCVWLDTWRVDFMNAFKTTSTSDHVWEYNLWGNDKVRHMPMLNRDLFDAETAFQCQADILRLEVLYEYGGVYVDADIVSTVRDLRPALTEANETGFLITYEPDTKDKPYSVLGNSLIACTPKHPLILMLMAYIKQVYVYKRAHYSVEWVTGPLTYTKVLIHTNMPVTIPPSKQFYPAFHYVPNPSAIDVTTLDSFCFQFGYTCSGLSRWVEENNKCRQAHQCSYHSKVQYSLGTLKQFPVSLSSKAETSTEIPPLIHQFAFQSEAHQPIRWIDTWREQFCQQNAYKHVLWTWKRLKEEIGSFYCANLYEEGHMDSFCLQMLALEVLQSHGGYYVPLTTIFTGDENDVETSNAIFGSSTALQFGNGSIIGYPPGMCLEKIKECYDNGKVRYDVKTRLPKNVVSDMGFGDEVAAFAHFKSGSRFLGAGEMYDASDIEANSKLESAANAALIWAYDCQVPIFRYPSEQQVTSAIRTSKKRVVVITDDQIGLYPSLMNVLPGVMYRLDNELGQDWDFIVFNIEWEVDEEELAVYKACSPFKAPTARYLGFIANTEASQFIKSLSIENVLEQHGSGRVFVASEKSKHSAKLSSMLKSMPSIERAFQSLAGFTPSFERDDMEVQDNLLKGFRDGQIAFELQVDDEQRIMFRSWYDGGINCECKILSGINGLSVEWLRYYEDHQLAYETSGTFVR